MSKIVNNTISIVLVMSFSMAFCMKALAGNQITPYSNLNIIALEIIESENILRLFIKRRIRINAPVFDFNPANCPDVSLSKPININGKTGLTPSIQYFDIPFGEINRSAIEQRQLLSETFAAFLTSREVRIYVRDDACSSMYGRLVSGIAVTQ